MGAGQHGSRREFLKQSLVVAGSAMVAGRALGAFGAEATTAAAAPANALPSAVKFEVHRLGHVRSEACGVADFNGDGKLDILAGEYLYPAPDFKPVKVRTIKGMVDDKGDGYRWDFANLPMDVDGDGKMDVISVNWFDKRAWWEKNTGVGNGDWPQAEIARKGPYETAYLLDVEGNGKLKFVPDTARTVWYDLVKGSDGKPEFKEYVVSEKAMKNGLGVGDIIGKGKPAIIRPNAWYEAPEDIRTGKWIEHPLALGGPGDGKSEHTAHILVHDVNGDGLNDLICSSAHNSGIYWYEQIRENGEIKFKQHLIDDTWTQVHNLVLGDIDGDGLPELVTGKRFKAHSFDPGVNEPLGLYYYKLERKPTPKWTKYVISFDEGIGAGLNVCLVDLTGSGRLDIVTTGKFGGPVWLENKGIVK
jgi:hypothetical protein